MVREKICIFIFKIAVSQSVWQGYHKTPKKKESVVSLAHGNRALNALRSANPEIQDSRKLSTFDSFWPKAMVMFQTFFAFFLPFSKYSVFNFGLLLPVLKDGVFVCFFPHFQSMKSFAFLTNKYEIFFAFFDVFLRFVALFYTYYKVGVFWRYLA